MKDKEKQIEEMSDIIFNSRYKNDYISPLKSANELYNAGYRKLPKDSVALSKEDYHALLLEQKRLKEIVDRIPCCYELKEKTSKETAEKIYLQAKAIVDATKHIVQGREYLHINALKEIIKSCGVEIKE